MPYLPSLLEYTKLNLQAKINLIKNNYSQFLEFQKSKDGKLYLHLDFVLPDFAREEKVLIGLGLPQVFEALERNFANQEIYLSIHLMGEEQDMDFALGFLTNALSRYVFEKPNWTGVVFVDKENFKKFQKFVRISHFKTGYWYNLNEWSEDTFFEMTTEVLLMTVQAGKSGQSLTQENLQLVYEIAKAFPKTKFTLDGGWKMGAKLRKNVCIVSYTSFWQEFDKIAKSK